MILRSFVGLMTLSAFLNENREFTKLSPAMD